MTLENAAPASPSVSSENPEYARLILEGIQDFAIFMLDSGGIVRSWNAGAERVKGYSAAEAIGLPYRVFFPESDQRHGKPARILETAALEGRYEEEGWRVRKDGSRFWASIVLTALRNEDDELIGFAKVTRDVTERKLAEEALHQSEERFRMLVESVRDYAVFMLSVDGRVISWNNGAQRINGYQPEEILGKHFSVFYPPEDIESDKPSTELEIAIADGKYEEEGWRIRKDGSRFWSGVVISPIRDQGGTLLGFAKVTRDMTERRRAREQLLASQQQARDLSLSNAAKDEFLGIVAHELRTPLAVLYGSAQMLRTRMADLTPENRDQLVDALATETERMRSLVENLLALARPDRQESLVLQTQNVGEAVLAGVETYRRGGGGQVVHVSLPEDDTPLAPLEPAYFERVVINLLENAEKYSSRKDRAVDIVVSVTSSAVLVDVMDRGPGVDPAELSLIFESFYRSSRTAGTVRGKGLGLAVCKRLVGMMNGRIEAMPRLGGGLTVRITLPRGDLSS